MAVVVVAVGFEEAVPDADPDDEPALALALALAEELEPVVVAEELMACRLATL